MAGNPGYRAWLGLAAGIACMALRRRRRARRRVQGSRTTADIHPVEKGDAVAVAVAEVDVFSATAPADSERLVRVTECAAEGDGSPMPHQTAASSSGEPSDFAMAAGVRKIPSAMDWPTTRAMVPASPMRRFCSGTCGASIGDDVSWLGVGLGIHRKVEIGGITLSRKVVRLHEDHFQRTKICPIRNLRSASTFRD